MELVVNADAVLPDAISAQRFQAVPRGDAEVIEASSDVQLAELATCQSFGIGASKRADHFVSIVPPRRMVADRFLLESQRSRNASSSAWLFHSARLTSTPW